MANHSHNDRSNDREPTGQPVWNERLDCFRPDHHEEDGRLPELTDIAQASADDAALAEALKRCEAWDRLASQALREAPVPEGLAQRLEQQLEEQLEASSPSHSDRVFADRVIAEAIADHEEAGAAPRNATPATPAAPPASNRARSWWPAFTGVAVAACIAFIAFIVLRGPATVTGEQLVQMADTWTEQWASQDNWSTSMPPSSHPIDPTIAMPVGATPWQTTSLLGDRNAVVYQSRAATLVVIQASHVTHLGGVPPLEPQFQTGSRRIGAWANKDLVYVLIVRGDLAHYQSMLQRPFDA